MGLALYVTLGALFVVLGLGSLRRRRWAPPLIVIFGRIWILAGLTLLVFLPGLVDALLVETPGLEAIDGGLRWLVKLAVVGGTAAVAVMLPLAFVWAYRHPDVAATCRQQTPGSSWTERCSPVALGLSVGLAACAALLLPLALRPVVPLFGLLLTGWPAGVAIFATALACAWLARGTFDELRSAWWLSTAFFGLLGLSTLATLARVDPLEIYRAVGYSERELRLLEGTAVASRAFNAGLITALTVACLAYMVAIRRHFPRRGRVR